MFTKRFLYKCLPLTRQEIFLIAYDYSKKELVIVKVRHKEVEELRVSKIDTIPQIKKIVYPNKLSDESIFKYLSNTINVGRMIHNYIYNKGYMFNKDFTYVGTLIISEEGIYNLCYESKLQIEFTPYNSEKKEICYLQDNVNAYYLVKLYDHILNQYSMFGILISNSSRLLTIVNIHTQKIIYSEKNGEWYKLFNIYPSIMPCGQDHLFIVNTHQKNTCASVFNTKTFKKIGDFTLDTQYPTKIIPLETLEMGFLLITENNPSIYYCKYKKNVRVAFCACLNF